jgi:glycosyltransferase involved in cell wall biosynthesis
MHVLILGTRGIPSKHSGFETFAQDLALFLRDRGHRVTVYCQAGAKEPLREDTWSDIRRVFIPAGEGSLGSIIFDWKAIRHSLKEEGVVLTLGYNTACFNILYRLGGKPNIMNMDGIEWKRQKWSLPSRVWFWVNEWMGARIATHLVADHPQIKQHLTRHTAPEKISVIPYGADLVSSADVSLIERYELSPQGYYLVIARPEPENSILEIVNGYSLRSRGIPLVILGRYSQEGTEYQKLVLKNAGPEVKFLGPIFDRDIVKALRFYARAYFHGHQVGGTNPSLVESLAASNAVIAHDNRFTRWVAGDGARYFASSQQIDDILTSFESDPTQLQTMQNGSRQRYMESFTQESILSSYEDLLAIFASELPVERYAKAPTDVSA